MAGKKSTEKELLWRDILSRQAGSDLSIREFCAIEGISEPSFYSWRKKLGARRNGRGPGATRRQKDAPENGQLFVPLQLVEGGPSLEIVHPLGYRIQVSGDVDPVTLRHVIAALDERGAR
jgi:hypothetical protein